MRLESTVPGPSLTEAAGAVRTVEPTSVAELLDVLLAMPLNPAHNHLRSTWVYRGMSNRDYEIKSGLARLGDHAPQVEASLLRNFRRYANPNTGVSGHSFWDDLAIAQHYGLPTRFIDWTNSPLIGLHFALGSEPNEDVDGVVWMLDIGTEHLLPPTLAQVLDEQGGSFFTTEMLSSVQTFGELDALRADGDFVVLFQPPALDDRITNQYALLSVLPHPTETMDTFIARHTDIAQRVIVSKELKWEARDILDQANITERILFPGLAGLSSWLKRYYGPAGQRGGE